jgi:hypothetical protein
MNESQLRRVQEVSSQRLNSAFDYGVPNCILAPSSVGRIADSRVANVRKVYTNLMSATGLDLDL